MSIRVLFFESLFLLVLLLLLLSCAGQVPPGGGPSDTDPPRIISTSPAPYTTSYRGNVIVFEFDEYVDRSSFVESIFISPSVGELTFDWSGTEVEIQFGSLLRENTTYVVTIGTDVRDTRNRNRMAQSFSLAFSTGTRIDPGAIEGRVYPLRSSDSPEGVIIFAYTLEGRDADTLNPARSRPDYVTQTGNGGKFFLYHLVLGTYRLYAIRDEYKNLLYDPETDEYAVPAYDVRLTESDTLRGDVTLQMAKEDTTGPRLIKVSPLHDKLLLTEFSEPIDTSSIRKGRFSLSDTLGAHQIVVRSIAPKLPKRNEFLLVTDSQAGGVLYQLRVAGLKDDAGLEVSGTANTALFTASGEADTTKPAVAGFSIADSVRDISLLPDLVVFLSEPVLSSRPDEIVSLRDSSGAIVNSRIEWLNPAAIMVRPLRELTQKAWYLFSVKSLMLHDPSGNRGDDTTRALRFETIDSERFSSVEGFVRDANMSDTGMIFLKAINTSPSAEVAKAVSIPRPGPFSVGNIVEGKYTVHAFRDRNKNGIFDAGTVFPFGPSERFSFFRDTVRVRARWPVEGVTIELK